MSTKKIREALERLTTVAPSSDGSGALYGAAMAEVEAIEKAARDLSRLHIGDYTYNVRDSAHVLESTPDGQSTWEHPDVKAWSDASVIIDTIAKESTK